MKSKSCLRLLVEGPFAIAASETIERIEISGRVPSGEAAAFADALAGIGATDGWSFVLKDGEFEDLLVEQAAGEDFTLTVTKPTGGRLFFCTLNGFRHALREPALATASEIHVLGALRAFATRRFRLVPWDGDLLPPLNSVPPDPTSEANDPRRGMVRDLTGSEVTSDALLWLLLGEPGECAVWEAWRIEAAIRLALLPTTEVWSEAGALRVSLHGGRKRTFDFGAADLNHVAAYGPLSDAAEWLVMGRGAEARHEMLTRRLEAILPEVDSWCRTMPSAIREALDGAKIDYRAYARSKSTETLKVMADLRKAVGEDVSRIVERSQKLSQAFVASIIALAAGLGLRIGLFAGKLEGGLWSNILFGVVVLGVMWAGLLFQRRVNLISLRDDLRNMRKWHRSIQVALSVKEYNSLARRPVLDALRLYRRTWKWAHRGLTGASVVFMLLLVVSPLATSWGSSPPTPQQTLVQPPPAPPPPLVQPPAPSKPSQPPQSHASADSWISSFFQWLGGFIWDPPSH